MLILGEEGGEGDGEMTEGGRDVDLNGGLRFHDSVDVSFVEREVRDEEKDGYKVLKSLIDVVSKLVERWREDGKELRRVLMRLGGRLLVCHV